MEKLKALFGSEALTFEQLEEKLKDNKEVKLANLASGGYVDINKHNNTVNELTTAQNTLKDLQETVKKFDGVDVEKLKQDLIDKDATYKKDLEAVKLNSAVDLALLGAKAKNPKLTKAALDMSVIKLDGENLIGFTEQIDKLKESDSYLFGEDEPGGNEPRVNTGANHTQNTQSDKFFAAIRQGAGLDTQKGE